MKDPTIIVALDLPTARQALAMARRLGFAVPLKVGGLLWRGPSWWNASCTGHQVFLDLKFTTFPIRWPRPARWPQGWASG